MSRAGSLHRVLPRIAARGLVDQAVEALRHLVLSRKPGSGGALPSQGELARRLGVSRPVVREAMGILQSQGLVNVTQGKRPRVSPAGPRPMIESLGTLLVHSGASLLDLVEARRPIESEIAALAASRAGEDDRRSLKEAVEELRQARTLEARVEADVRFHACLARATRNPILEWLLEALATPLRESRRKTIAESGVEVPTDHHRRILRAIEAQDPDEARRAMLHHLEMARGDILKSERKRKGSRR